MHHACIFVQTSDAAPAIPASKNFTLSLKKDDQLKYFCLKSTLSFNGDKVCPMRGWKFTLKFANSPPRIQFWPLMEGALEVNVHALVLLQLLKILETFLNEIAEGPQSVVLRENSQETCFSSAKKFFTGITGS